MTGQTLILEPHNDDCALFCAFTAIPTRAHVVTVFRSFVQERRGTGITAAVREAESRQAMAMLGCTWETLSLRDDEPVNAGSLQRRLAQFARFDVCYAPAPEDEDGHEQHDAVGAAAAALFRERARFYTTYRRGHGRTETSLRVDPEPDWIVQKHLALAFYGSQIREPTTRPWFLDSLDEWLVPAVVPA